MGITRDFTVQCDKGYSGYDSITKLFSMHHDFLFKPIKLKLRKSYSMDTCLLYLTDTIRREIDEGNLCGMVLLDLQKAFDTVNHHILLSKMKALGMDPLGVKWLASYLTDRDQRVEVNGTMSEAKPIGCGVPQGSILGPLLFLLYINDMRDACSCKLFLYADDSALLIAHKDLGTLQRRLGEELSNVSIWLADNRLSLHLGKTESILFGSKPRLKKAPGLRVELGTKVIEAKKAIKYLGCMLDDSLGGEEMALQVVGKVNARTKLLSRKANLLDRDSLRLLANSLVQPHFDYASMAWYGGLTEGLKQKLQVSQNKLVRVVMDLGPRDHVGRSQLQELNWLPVEARVTQLRLAMVHRIINDRAPNYLTNYFSRVGEAHSHRTRASRANLHSVRCKRKIGQCSFAFQGSQAWNNLPLDIKEASNQNNFKAKVRRWLLDKVLE